MSSFLETAVMRMRDSIVNEYSQRQDLTPVQQNYLRVLQSGNQNDMDALATDICNSMGCTKEQAVSQALQYLK